MADLKQKGGVALTNAASGAGGEVRLGAEQCHSRSHEGYLQQARTLSEGGDLPQYTAMLNPHLLGGNYMFSKCGLPCSARFPNGPSFIS